MRPTRRNEGKVVDMATIRDVARLADVSVATVSFVLNKTKPISKQTTQRVLQAMDTLNYHPNALAQGLASRRSGLIAVLYPSGEQRNIGDINELLSGAAEAASQLNHTVVLWPVSDISTVTNLVRSGLTDGIVITRIYLQDSRIAVLEQAGIRYVPIGRTLAPLETSFIDIDFETSALECLARLKDLGHRVVSYLGPDTDNDSISGYGPTVRSLQAIQGAAKNLGILVLPWESEDSPTAGRKALRSILASDPSPSAIVSSCPRAAFGLIHEARSLGIEIPSELSIALFNTPPSLSSLSDPVLDQWASPGRKLGEGAVKMLVRSLGLPTDEDSSPEGVLLPCVFRPGGSVSQAPR